MKRLWGEFKFWILQMLIDDICCKSFCSTCKVNHEMCKACSECPISDCTDCGARDLEKQAKHVWGVKRYEKEWNE